MPDEITNIAIYTRVSTEEQAEGGFSLDYQLEKLRAFCVARDFNIVGEYVESGESGTTTKRPQYQKMMDNIDKWDGILVVKMDRLHRSQINFTQMMVLLSRNYKHFVSMTESYDTSTAIGRLLMDFSVRLAQFESEQTGERTYIGMKQKARDPRAGWNGGKPPFGYRVVDGKFIPIPEDLNMVKIAYEMYNEGNSIPAIAKHLKQQYGNVQFWLRNPIYAGFKKWSNVIRKFPVDPVISPMLFNQVQRLKAKKSFTNKKTIGDYQPLILNGKDVFEVKQNDIKAIAAIKKPKHNLKY